MDCIVFSRDRAMQLEAFLRSARQFAGKLFDTVSVIYRSTSDEHAEGYRVLREEADGVTWIEEQCFRDDVIDRVGSSLLTVFHTDDDVFFRTVSPPTLGDDEVCFTLRLGLNTTYSYALDLNEELVDPAVAGERVSWRWADQAPGSYSYPLALNGHIFRTDHVRRWLHQIEFANPNELESALQGLRDQIQPRIASYLASCVVSVPANRVNESYANRYSGEHGIWELNDRFLAGERIDIDAMDFTAVVGAHQAIPYVFTAGRFSGPAGECHPNSAKWADEQAQLQAMANREWNQLRELQGANAWLEEQRAAWQKAAAEQSEVIDHLTAANATLEQELAAERTELEKQAELIERLNAEMRFAPKRVIAAARRWLRA